MLDLALRDLCFVTENSAPVPFMKVSRLSGLGEKAPITEINAFHPPVLRSLFCTSDSMVTEILV